MKSAWKLSTLGIVISMVLSGCTSEDLGWGTRSAQPIPARPLHEASSMDQAEAPTSQPAAGHADGTESEALDPEVAPLNAQIQAFTGRVVAAGSDENTTNQSIVPVGPSPTSQPVVRADHTSQPPENMAVIVRGQGVQVTKVYMPTQPETQPSQHTESRSATADLDAATVTTANQAPLVVSTKPRPAPNSAGFAPVNIAQPQAAPAAPSPSTTANSLGIEIVEVRPAAMTPAAGPAALASSPNQPADPELAANGIDLKLIIEKLERDMEQRPPHPDDQIRLRLLYLAAGLPLKATGPIDGMDPVQGELLSAVLQTVASTRQAILEPTQANPTALTAAEELRRLLGQQAGVIIARIAMVTRVSSFGDYEVISPLRFRAGQAIHAYVYTEVANYHSEPTEDGRLRTLLSEKIEVFSNDGKSIWQRTESSIEDRVRTPRRDFFIPFPIQLPATLAAGQYVIKVTIEDRIGGTTDQQRLTFSIYD